MPEKKSNNKPVKPSKRAVKPHRSEAKAPVEPTNRKKGIPVVGIGASAGGLKALEAFFTSMPLNTGMAFVVVTHLHPEHESYMAELLQKYTAMPTKQVTKRIKVESDHVYVIPPNRSIVMTDSHLDVTSFTQPHGHRTPIDHFFRSLASPDRETIAVILSGGGTDGSVGVKDIKELGGLLMVQDPKDAEFDSMPNAAINTGLADIILPAAQLPSRLEKYIRHRPQLPHDPGQFTEQELNTVQHILSQVHARTGQDFNQYKPSTILRRIERRMQLNGFTTLDMYLNYLRQNASESQLMFNDILIGVTNFFRDHDSWKAMEDTIIPALFERKTNGESIRVWTIGCATGEEAYGIAMLLFEHAARLEIRPQIQIFASDLDERSIARAREGYYPAAIEADVSPERLEKFFTREGEYYRVKHELRDAILFTNHNVLRDPPFSHQDLIACRNVMIYLQRPVQDKMFEIFHYALNPLSYLFLGSSESAEHLPELFNVLDKTHRLYQARPWSGQRPHVPSMPMSMTRGPRIPEPYTPIRPNVMRYVDETPGVEEQHLKALENSGPPSILINDRYSIYHISETAGRYLVQPKGPITGDLLKLARPELQLELRTVLYRAFENDKATLSRPIAVQFNGHPHKVVIAVRPTLHTTRTSSEKQALVIFIEDELEELLGMPDQPDVQQQSQTEQTQLIKQLENEAQHLREQLQVTIEEYDSSNEEMKAANEELQSINEEYRSATEELETSKEELQSVNEELQTVNSEMKGKLDEILSAHRELENLMGATEIAMLFLDRDLRIQRFTPSIRDLFNIMPNDSGRPINHLTHNLLYDQFLQDAEKVLRTLVPIEQEVVTENDHAYLLRLRPYRTVDDKIEGVVISFVDITRRKEAERLLLLAKQNLEERVIERTSELDEVNERLRQTRDLFYALFNTNPLPTALTTLDNANFIDINEAYLRYFNLKRVDIINHSAQEFHLPLDPNIRPQLIARLKAEGVIRDLEMRIMHPTLAEERIILIYLQLLNVEGTESLIQTFTDITERVHTEQLIRSLASDLTQAEQEERRRISQVLHDDLQQRIFAIKMQISLLESAYQKENKQSSSMDFSQLENWLNESITITRNLSMDLSPAILQGEGLIDALEWLAAHMQEQHKLKVHVKNNNADTRFDSALRILLFQAVREALFNIVKHAEILEAFIIIKDMGNHIRLTIRDHGKGFNIDGIANKTIELRGLLNLQHRLSLMGCKLDIQSQDGDGTQVVIDIPHKKEET